MTPEARGTSSPCIPMGCFHLTPTSGPTTGRLGNYDVLVQRFWEREVNVQPGDLGSSFTLATSFLYHPGQVMTPLRVSGPFLVNDGMGRGLEGLLQLKHPVTILQIMSHPLLRNIYFPFSLLLHVHFSNQPSFCHWTPWYSRMIFGIRQSWAQNQPSSHSLAGWSWANLCFLICAIRMLEPGRATGRDKLNNLKAGQSDFLLVGLTSGNTITTPTSSPYIVAHTIVCAWHKLLTLIKMC